MDTYPTEFTNSKSYTFNAEDDTDIFFAYSKVEAEKNIVISRLMTCLCFSTVNISVLFNSFVEYTNTRNSQMNLKRNSSYSFPESD